MDSPISAIIITLNESKNISECIDSLRWCREIIVVDSGSTDDTVARARDAGARVHITEDWPGFGVQKNRALALATQPWILSIDADERVSPALAREIQMAIAENNRFDAYAVPRLSSYCGQYMRHGGWYPDVIVRLFRRGKARFSNALVHESVQVQGTIGRLHHHLYHESFHDLEQVLVKLNVYSTSGAQMMLRDNRSSGVLTALVHGWWTFIRCYVLKLGFLDGRLGYVLAMSNAHGAYYRYLKLWLINKKRSQEKQG
jgi:glycosyltransferase involved in cell wall biosynthesis